MIDTDFEQKMAGQSEFSKLLGAMRDERKLSMDDLASKTGIHRNTLTRILRNPEGARVRQIIEIGDALGVPEWKVFRRVRKLKAKQCSEVVQG